MAGPFYTLSPAQWQIVRETHRRFIEDKDLGRPLILSPYTRHGDEEPPPDEPIVLAGPKTRLPAVDEGIRQDIRQAWRMRRSSHCCDGFPAITPLRDHYGHSQRLAEAFGGAPYMEYGHCQAIPVIQEISDVRALQRKAVKDCPFLSAGRALLRYLYESTEGHYPIRQMVTTGPFDTANYLTGTTLLLESLYTHPDEVHLLLRMVTEVIIEEVLACREAVNGHLVPDHTRFINGYTFCSELRSEISADHVAEFEAPYLAEIGKAVGPLIIHSSGRWEQSIAATLADPNIFHIVLWVRDTDLSAVTAMIGDRVSIEAWRSDLEQCGFADAADYYRYLLAALQPETRLVFTYGVEADDFAKVCDEFDRAGMLPPQLRRLGRPGSALTANTPGAPSYSQ